MLTRTSVSIWASSYNLYVYYSLVCNIYIYIYRVGRNSAPFVEAGAALQIVGELHHFSVSALRLCWNMWITESKQSEHVWHAWVKGAVITFQIYNSIIDLWFPQLIVIIVFYDRQMKELSQIDVYLIHMSDRVAALRPIHLYLVTVSK